MDQRIDDEQLMRRYLLGALAEEEQAEMEDRFFADDEVYERLEMAKDDLIEDYLDGILSSHERAQFESHFVASPRWRQEVGLTRALMKVASRGSAHQTTVPERAEPVAVSWQQFFQALPGKIRWAVAASLLVGTVGGTWLVGQTVQLRRRLATEEQAWQQRESELERQLAEQQKRGSELAQQLEHERAERERIEQELLQGRPAVTSILSMLLLPTRRLRGESVKPARLVIVPGVRTVRLELALDTDEEFSGFQAALRRRGEENELWSASQWRAQTTGQGKTIGVRVPANIFTPGDYRLVLNGVTADGNVDEIHRYDFTVAVGQYRASPR
jgi:anti-sigma factor RsiW